MIYFKILFSMPLSKAVVQPIAALQNCHGSAEASSVGLCTRQDWLLPQRLVLDA